MTVPLTAPAPAQRDDWVENAEGLLREKVATARELRNVGHVPSLEHGPLPLTEMLVTVRARMDAIEVLQDEIIAFRTRARVLLKESEAAVDDKWAERVVQPPSTRRRASFDGTFDTAPRERYAQADLAVLEDRRKARRRDRVMDACNDAVDRVRVTYRGLDGVRMDLHAMLRGLSVETRLER